MLLGLGPDGHVASLFPNRSQLAATDSWVLPVENSPKPPPERITFSLPVINRFASQSFPACKRAGLSLELLVCLLPSRCLSAFSSDSMPISAVLLWNCQLYVGLLQQHWCETWQTQSLVQRHSTQH